MINKTYKQYVLDVAFNRCPVKKKSIYAYSYYYDMFLLVLEHVNSWRSLAITLKYSGKSKYHYTTIRKMFNKWSVNNVFKIAYNQMLLDYRTDQHYGKEVDLFIDALLHFVKCFIANKTGSELVGINPTYYKKNVTKLSIVCDSNKVPLTITAFKTTVNDCKTVIDSIKHLDLKRSINLITDKGYMTKKCDKIVLYKNYKIKLITPRKKNQKNIRISKIMRSKLKVRNKVENCIQSIKRFDRTMVRKDRKLHNYMGFVYIACGLNLFNKITVN
jgi:hypothetical protein